MAIGILVFLISLMSFSCATSISCTKAHSTEKGDTSNQDSTLLELERSKLSNNSIGPKVNKHNNVIKTVKEKKNNGNEIIHSSRQGEMLKNPLLSKDMERVLFIGVNRGTESVGVKNITSGKIRFYGDGKYFDHSADWSLDERSVVVSRAKLKRNAREGWFNFEIWKINTENGESIKLTDSSSGEDQLYPCFSPDGNKIVWTNGNLLWVMDKDGKNKRALTDNISGVREVCGDWAPDSLKIAYIFKNRKKKVKEKIRVISMIDKNNEKVIDVDVFAVDAAFSIDGKSIYYSNNEGIHKINFESRKGPQTILNGTFERFDMSFNENCIVFDDSDSFSENNYVRIFKHCI